MSLSLISTFQTEDKLIPLRLMMVEIIIEAEYVLARPLLPPPLTSHPPSTSTCPLPSPSNRKWQVQTSSIMLMLVILPKYTFESKKRFI